MEDGVYIATVKEWNGERKRYQTKETHSFSDTSEVKYGGIRVSLDEDPPIFDPGSGKTITLRKIKGEKPEELLVEEDRTIYKNPRSYVVGKTIMRSNPFFYFSNLDDFRHIRIYKGKPQEGKHPEYLEIIRARNIGEDTSGSLLR